MNRMIIKSLFELTEWRGPVFVFLDGQAEEVRMYVWHWEKYADDGCHWQKEKYYRIIGRNLRDPIVLCQKCSRLGKKGIACCVKGEPILVTKIEIEIRGTGS